jgi:cytochrome b
MDPKLVAAIERLLTIYITYFITKYGSGLQSAAPDIVVVVISVLSLGWGVYNNRKAGLLTRAASIPEVKEIKLTNGPESSALNQATPAKITMSGESK